ncbi:hypothetical protein [Pararhizobium arenae]|uniref:hypothetical protein n=1 Tax=Pararhizobium arenae TaxID=1856850 RepID=UPI00094B4DCB|nr:hypothetical protein [Pararhizobium arenae]
MPTVFKHEKGHNPNDEAADIIAYIRHMLGELRTIAAGQSEDMLVYLIEMAAVEASDVVLRRKGPLYGEIDGNEPARVAVKTPRKI